MKQLINKSFILICLTVVAIFTFSCKEEDSDWFPVSGSGAIVSQERAIPGFTKIKSSISGNIIIADSNEQQIKVSAQENLLDLLETEVVNGTLYISFGSRAVSTDSIINLVIFTDKIDVITISGSGTVNSALAISTIDLPGSASLKCSGTLDKVSVKLSGTGTINLSEMSVKQANVKITGNGNVSLNVAQNLNVDILGVGIVYYRGLPTIQKNITGTGQIIWQD